MQGRIYNIIADFLEDLLIPHRKYQEKVNKKFEIFYIARQEAIILLENKNKSVREHARRILAYLEALQREIL